MKELHLVLPIQLGLDAQESSFGAGGVGDVREIVGRPEATSPGESDRLLPATLEQRAAQLRAHQQLVDAIGVVRVIDGASILNVVNVGSRVEVVGGERKLPSPKERRADAGTEVGSEIWSRLQRAGRDSVAAKIACAERIIDPVGSAGDRGHSTCSLRAASFSNEAEARGSGAFPSDDVDHAPDRVGAVEAACGAAKHFDAVDVLGGEVGEID